MSDYNIHTATPQNKPGHYDTEVRALLAAIREQDNDDLVIDIQVPTGEEAKHKRYFQATAKQHDRTGRAVNETVQGDGSTVIEFALVPRVKRKRKATSDADDNVPTAA